MGVTFTKEQQQVIDLRNRNILVSAAAGSGKTAVLVERIITRLTKDNPPLDVDQLLVVTYTEAAASEMKERIRNAIEKALEEKPEDVHLQRQATLVHHAQVTTIHSFCLSVIRDYFHTIDLDPGFRIAEEGELKLLKRDVLEEVLEKWYAEGKSEFTYFVESYATGRDDRKLEEIVLQLYEYSRSYPNPERWLDGCAGHYDVASVEEMENAPFMKIIMDDVKSILQDVEAQLTFAMDICNQENGPLAYLKAITSDLNYMGRLLAADSFTKMQEIISQTKWERLGTNRNKLVSAYDINLVKGIRDECKKLVEGIREEYFYDTPEELQRGILSAKANMGVLTELVKDFSSAFAFKKQQKNMIDFNDMEHYALQILTKEENGVYVPSPVAKEYQEKYKEVMIDEYQDSNYIQEAILTSVSTVSKEIYNVFMVGDVKQSIYRFRLSRPELFMEKYGTYSQTDGKKQRIDLHKNFRSRREVLDSTNFIFRQIMRHEFGGIEYDEKAALYVGASYEPKAGNETEICMIDTSELNADDNKREVEARAVARRIKKLTQEHEVLDKKTGEYRKASYGDIVILTRSLKGWTDVFLRVLSQEGIPAYSVSKEGYFETREIQLLLNYLRILDNPSQDIPLIAVLTSQFANVTSEELALLKSEVEANTYYERICVYAESGNNLDFKEKLNIFLKTYREFRKMVPYTAIHVLLWKIIENTGYGNYVAALPGGEQRAANLEMLVEKAIAFESTSYKGLFHFVRYIEQLYKYEVDYGEANIVDETADVVRLMSIHKSKGLEFPIVFVAGMDKGFNLQDARSSVVIHPELGVGLDFIDIEKRVKYPSLLKRMIQKEVQKESVAEELRVLYVAMTRAKEKLIMTGTISNLEKKINGCAELADRMEIKLPYTKLTSAKKYFDWIIPALFRNQCFCETLEKFESQIPVLSELYGEEVPILVRYINVEDIVLDEMEEEYCGIISKQILQNWDTEQVYDLEVKKQILEQFQFSYPYPSDPKTKQKVSVSELKKKVYLEEEEIEEEEIIPLLPKFLQEEETVSGASRGTAYHRVLELLDFRMEYDENMLKQAVCEMVAQHKINAEMAESVEVRDILHFLNSPIGIRVRDASRKGKVHAEQPFVIAEEELLVQGIIDVYFEEEDGLVVLDYKTDKIWKAKELADRYRMQLEYYAKALEAVTEKKVKQKIIYSFTMQREIEV